MTRDALLTLTVNLPDAFEKLLHPFNRLIAAYRALFRGVKKVAEQTKSRNFGDIDGLGEFLFIIAISHCISQLQEPARLRSDKHGQIIGLRRKNDPA